MHYRLTGDGIKNVNSIFVTSGGNTSISHVFNSSITSFTDYFEPKSLEEFVVDIRSIITHPEFYEVEVHEPVLLDVSMGSEEDATEIVSAEFAYIGGKLCTDPDSNLTTSNNCSFSFLSGNADGIYTLCINITDGEDYDHDCSAETIVINTLNVPPNMSTVFMNSTNNTFSEKENLYCWANASDADEDDFSVEGFWFRNGEIVPDLNFTTYPNLNDSNDLVYAGFAPWTAIEDEETWSCSVRAYDLRTYSDYLSSGNITIIFGAMMPEIHATWHTPNFTRQGGDITFFANVTDNNTQANIADVILHVIPAEVGIARNYSMIQVSGQIWSINYTAFHSGTYNYSIHARDQQNLYAFPLLGSYDFSAEGMAYVSIAIAGESNNSFVRGDIINITNSS